MMATLEFHSVCELFPKMDDADLKKLALDIQENGQHVPIELYHGKIIDGRNRYLACQLLDIEPLVADVPEGVIDGCPEAYVVSMNLARRHLSASQRAMLAVKLLPAIEARAAARREANQFVSDKAGSGENVEISRDPAVSAPVRSPEKGKSSDDAGELFGVSGRTVEQAKVIDEMGSLALKKAVKEGAIPVKQAERMARDLPKVDQTIRVKEMLAAKKNEETKPRARKQSTDRQAGKKRLEKYVAWLGKVHALVDDVGDFGQLHESKPWPKNDSQAFLDLMVEARDALNKAIDKFRRSLKQET